MLWRYANLFPSTKFVAIEANPATAMRLRKSFDRSQVSVMNIHASDSATEPPGQDGEVTKVACNRLDALALPAGDLVLKINIEDDELPVLEGASRLLEENRMNVIYLDGYSSAAIPGLLRQHGFGLFDGRALARCDRAVPDFLLLAVHRSRLHETDAS